MHQRSTPDDEGFTLIEVIVAMVVFAIVMTGFLLVVTASLSQTRDTRTRIVAANLAAQTIDLARSANSVFDVTHDKYSRSATLNGDTFHIDLSTSWQDSAGGIATCETGAATTSLAYKNITVTVTWDNMSGGPVVSNTALTPKTKLNNTTLGTVLVRIIDAAGTGVNGAKVTLDPESVPAVTTDSDGCAYLLKVPAGDYTVEATKTGYVNEQHLSTPSATTKVAAGSTARVSFAYDRATTFNASYAAGGALLPTNLTTTFISTYGAFKKSSTTNANPKSFSLFPISSGYSVVAGGYADAAGLPPAPGPVTGCLAPDPSQWAADGTRIGIRPDPVAGAPGGSASVTVAVGVVTLASAGGTGDYLKATYVGGGAGDPGCADKMEYVFGKVMTTGSAKIALPYGTWKLYRGNASSQTSAVTTGITVAAPHTVSGGTIVLDPRVTP